MKKNILKICAFAAACLTFLFLIVGLCVHGDARTAMMALSLIFTIGTIVSLVLDEFFKRRTGKPHIGKIGEPKKPKGSSSPTPIEKKTPIEPRKPNRPMPTEIVR